MRKLASIQYIKNIEVIPGADKIEKATVLGWQLCVEKGKFNVGDLCVYIECDSILPECPEFEFLRNKSFRIKTIRLKGQISQGICFPLSILPENFTIEEGMDCTEILSIKKWEAPIPACLSGLMKGGFPSFFCRTDETRVQVLQELLDKYKDEICYVSEKLDGCMHYSAKVKTDIGEIEIGRIVNQKMKVMILTYNELTQKNEFKKIEHYHKYENKHRFLNIGVGHRGKGNRTKYITCTDNHHFYSNGKWIEASLLKIGDEISHYSDNISFEMEQFILGGLLGDMSLHISNNCTFLHFGHSIIQSEYFDYKINLTNGVFNEIKGSKGGFPGSKPNRRAMSISSLSIKQLLDKYCIRNKKKKITKEWIDKITPLALAFWFMDDGSMENRDEKKQKPKISIATNCFFYKDVELLKNMLYNKFGIESEIRTKKSYKGNVLSINKDGSEIFFSLISPYVPTCMKYKIAKKFEKNPCVFENFCFSNKCSIINTKILEITEGLNKNDKLYDKYIYDLAIKDNHNYFVSNILVHNSSVSVFLRNNEFGVCSRNMELTESSENSLWKCARQMDLENKLKSLNGNFALQGEIIGEGIQGNKYKIKGQTIRFFNVFDIDKFEYFDYEKFLGTMISLDLPFVPILNDNYVLENDIPKLMEMAKIKSTLNPEAWAEGIVIRPRVNRTDNTFSDKLVAGRVSFKSINPIFLLENGE